jgi:hypothetical protein
MKRKFKLKGKQLELKHMYHFWKQVTAPNAKAFQVKRNEAYYSQKLGLYPHWVDEEEKYK